MVLKKKILFKDFTVYGHDIHMDSRDLEPDMSTFFPLCLLEGCIGNLTESDPFVSEEKSFENVER